MYKTQDKAAKTFFANINKKIQTNNFKLTKFPYFSLFLDAILISRTINELKFPLGLRFSFPPRQHYVQNNCFELNLL